MNTIELLKENHIKPKESVDAFGYQILHINSEDLVETIEFLKNNKQSHYNMLISISANDTTDNFELLYSLYSTTYNKKIIVKTNIQRQRPQIVSICNFFKGANWYERECFDLMGIEFIEHPNLTRLLMPKDWVGHPLRKDYILDDERLSWNNR